MHRIVSMCLDAAIAAFILIPLFLCLDSRIFHSKTRTFGYILFAVYLSGMFAVAGLPDVRYIRFDPNYNIIPFAYMFSDYENSLLNVLLFMPLGFFLPVFWEHFLKFPRTVLFGFFCSLFIESLQIFTYRATDINDLMTNTYGTFLGWCIARLVLHFAPRLAPSQQIRDVRIVCGSAFSVMFFIQPFLAEFFWSVLF